MASLTASSVTPSTADKNHARSILSSSGRDWFSIDTEPSIIASVRVYVGSVRNRRNAAATPTGTSLTTNVFPPNTTSLSSSRFGTIASRSIVTFPAKLYHRSINFSLCPGSCEWSHLKQLVSISPVRVDLAGQFDRYHLGFIGALVVLKLKVTGPGI